MIKIISGKYKNRVLSSPKNNLTRPTSIRLRQKIFDCLSHIINNNWQDYHVLDLFAGTGSLGIEALSRGSIDACFVDHCQNVIKLLENNLIVLNIDNYKIIKSAIIHLSQALNNKNFYPNYFNMVFIDPPYTSQNISNTLNILLENNWLKNNSLLICEFSKNDALNFNLLTLVKSINNGNTIVHIYHYQQ